MTDRASGGAGLRIDDLAVSLDGRHVIRDFTEAAAPGTITAIVGPNAAGKSTLLRAAAGLVAPAGGRVRIDGREVRGLDAAERARSVVWTPPRPSVALPFTVRQVVAMGRHALPRQDAAVDSSIEAMDLSAVADRPWARLSTGQQQRAAIARGMAQRGGAPNADGQERSGVWLLDEPTGPLDLRHAARLGEVLRAEAAAGAVVVITMHDLGRAADWADRVWVMDEGRLAAGGVPSDALAADVLEPVFGVRVRWIDDGDRRRLLPSG